MKNERLHWVDAVRGWALVFSMFCHLMRWLNVSFYNWHMLDPNSTWQIQTIRFIEASRMAWLMPFALSFLISFRPSHFSFQWIGKRFVLLLIVPTVIYSLLAFQEGFLPRWEIIQSLFIYNILALIIYDWSLKYRMIFYAGLGAICVYFHLNYLEYVDQSLFWKIFLGGFKDNIYFSIVSGFPAFFFFFEQLRAVYDVKTDTLKVKPILIAMGILALLYVASILTGFNGWEPKHNPPQFNEYILGIFHGQVGLLCCYLLRSKMTERSFLSILGRYCWVHFIGHLAVGILIFEYFKWGANQFNFISSFCLSVAVLLGLWGLNVLVLNFREKHGKPKE